MCGIAGVFNRNNITAAEVELVQRINVIQRHRGPDDEGRYSDESCVLGHRRLSIIDLSKDGHQPFYSDDGRYILVYNGEIYNYIELRSELEGKGWNFRTKTDTEVLLKAYLQYGKDCLEKINGMFAFAIYNKKEKNLFFARDRVGIKPLYYIVKNSTLYFASEIKALLLVPDIHFSLNNQSLFDYLVFNRTDVFDETFLNEIKRVPNGYYGEFSDDKLRLTQWWNPESYLLDSPLDDIKIIQKKIHEILSSAVDLRMRSDVPVGSCLSGGLDSSILIGILYNHNKVENGFPAFTAAFPGHPIDETNYVDDLNRQYPFKSHRTFPTAQSAYEQLIEFVYINDEPTTNPSFFSQYEVMKKASQSGITVLLDGQGGDENFAGYQYFHGFNLYGLLKNKNILAFCVELIKNIIRKQHITAYQTLLFQLLPDLARKKLLLKTIPYVESGFFYEYIESSKVYTEFFDADNLNMSLVRHFQYKLEHLLRMEDRNSMAFSLEARLPYLDYRLIEYVLGLSSSLKIKNGETKYLQKKSLGKYTTEMILSRTDKIGFGTPGEDWMKTSDWKKLTHESYNDLYKGFNGVFKYGVSLPDKGFDRWKINQLAVWKNIVPH